MNRKSVYRLLTLVLLVSIIRGGPAAQASTTTSSNQPAATSVAASNTQPGGQASVNAASHPLVPATPSSIEFSDVPPGSLWYTYVHWLAGHAVVSGIGGGLFAPNNNTTRAQFAKMVVLGFGYDLTTPGTPSFTDVPTSYFAYAFIETAHSQNIISGFTQAQCVAIGATFPCFGPNQLITRAQLVLIVARASGWTLITPSQPTFSDVPAGAFAFAQIETAVSKSVISGFVDNGNYHPCADAGVTSPCFRPNNNGTRGQLSRILYNALVPPGIAAERNSTIHGKVTDRASSPLAGVQISILKHPEYAPLTTDATGSFTMTVNGGGVITVNYSKTNYLPAQRQVFAPWQDDAWLPDVVLIGLDSHVTSVDFAQPMEVARGSTNSDPDGQRQATLMFAQGTGATMMLPDGTRQPLPSMHVRATEYTVGSTGPKAMPGQLPQTSAYTYASNFTADEALAAGATSITFTKPVVSYNENFLNFPVGNAVPAGYYDPGAGLWILDDNGRVIRILGVSGGLAILDVDGNGQPATPQELAALGITDPERQQLVNLYASGQSLWRVPTSHFTPWDMNWPYGPPTDTIKPVLPWYNNEQPWEDPCKKKGSIIDCQNQALGEALPINGTPFSLQYHSDRMPGTKGGYRLNVPIIAGTVPADLMGMGITIDIAGREITQTFAPGPNQTYNFQWDGRDAQGNVVSGTRQMKVDLTYTYPAVYYQSRGDFNRSFGDTSGVSYGRGEQNGRMIITLTAEQTYSIGGENSLDAGLGGWDLNVHHSYDPVNKWLYQGDGQSRGPRDIASIIDTVAGNGDRFGWVPVGDGGPATHSPLSAQSLAMAPDGSFYVGGGDYIRKIDRGGTITTIAGNLNSYGNGDGGPARLAAVTPLALALGPDENLYIADGTAIRMIDASGIITSLNMLTTTQFTVWHLAVATDGSVYFDGANGSANSRVLKRSPDGSVTVVAGTSTPGYSGDGGPASQAQLSIPQGLAVGPDGSLYIADRDNYRVRKVGVDGIITTVVGSGHFPGYGGCYSCDGDGGSALQANVRPTDLTLAPDGTLYISELNHYRIRQVRTDGIIEPVTGAAQYSCYGCGSGFSGDGGLATKAKISTPLQLAVGPDGALYFDDSTNNRVRRVTLPVPNTQSGITTIPAANGSELYQFDQTGRHLQTLNPNGSLRYRFAYDTAGRLTSVSDGDGNVTTIQRDSAGNPTAIVSPFGIRSSLSVGSDHYLASFANPAGETYHFTYGPGGLLTGMTTPAGGLYQMSYDGDGRLLSERDPGGGLKQLTRASDPYNVTSTFSSQAGATSTYHTTVVSGTQNLQTSAMPDGATSQLLLRSDSTRSITYANGTRAYISQDSDPRWGAQVPINAQYIITTPAGLTSVLTSSRQAALTYSGTVSSLVVQTDVVNLNNHFYQSVYNAPAQAVTVTSPLGRRTVTNLDSQGRPLSRQLDPGLAPLTYQYDSYGRLVQQHWGNLMLGYAYNSAGQIGSVTDAAGNATSYAYDLASRITSMTTAAGNTYHFSYDQNGNRTQVIMPNGSVHGLGYTTLGQLAVYTPTGSAPYVTTYNLAGERSQVTMPDGRAETYTRDSGDRFSGLSYPEANIAFAYTDNTDRPSLITRTSGVSGNQASGAAANPALHTPATAGVTETLAYAYDGGLITRTTWSGVANGSYHYRYDSNFRPIGITLDNNGEMQLGYDADGGLIRNDTFTINRNGPAGLPSGIQSGSALSMTLCYDNLARLNDRHHTMNGHSLYDVQMGYNPAGRINHKVEVISGTTYTYDYTYDPDGQLTQVQLNGTVVEHYTYDANGNRISRQLNGGPIETATYDAQDRQTSQGAVSYGFDQDGFLVSRGGDSFQYSTHGELLHASLAGGRNVDYSYDGLGRQVARTTISGTYQYLYGNPGNAFQVSAMRDPGGVLTIYYYDESGTLFALKQGYNFYYVASDQVGSPKLVVNAYGVVVKELSYDSFGDVTSDSNPSFYLPIGFAGGLRDVDTNLVHFGVRDYEPQTGRWVARDPALYQGGQGNLYTYVHSDPINQTDPVGLFSVGFSGFAAVGGSVSIAIDSGGLSISVGGGVGVGGGLSFDSGAKHQDSGVKTVAGASFAPGFYGVGVEASLDLDGCNAQASVSGNFLLSQSKSTYRDDTGKWSSESSDEVVYSGGANASASVQVVGTIGISW
ncbi:MAG: hypothetical protein DLM69_01740 [Candidatus Chloroheliales bacterium]|nr:MAG: hypothetical protein DLM69_01740 [Chloroflexota bacterium]